MPIGATLGAGALGAGGSLLSGWLGSNAATKAAGIQAGAINQGTQAALSLGQQGLGLLTPFANRGNAAGDTLASFYGLPGSTPQAGGAGALPAGFTNSAAYQFPFQQGQRATNFGSGASGLLQSGAGQKALTNFGSGLASTYLMSNYINPLMQISGQGANAAQSGANLFGQLGQTAMSGIAGAGAANAGGVVGSANALTGAIGSATNAFGGGIGNLALLSLLGRGGTGGTGGTGSSYTFPNVFGSGGSAWGGGGGSGSSMGFSPAGGLGSYGNGNSYPMFG